MDELLPNELLHGEMERLKAENYHLKRQLKNRHSENRGKDKYIKKLEKELKEHKKQKQHFRNNKRGTKFQG